MSKSTTSTLELFNLFPDQETARIYMEKRRWPDGPICPHCGEKKRIYERGNGYYKCNADLQVFTVRTDTIFGRSKVGLHKWLYAMYLFVPGRKGISSVQLSKQIGVTQKTAWLMLQRLREACGDDPHQLSEIAEIGESSFIPNEGDVKRHILDQVNSILSKSYGKRLSHKELIT